MKYLKTLVATSDDEEKFYDLNEVSEITCDLAQNILNKKGLTERGFKPLETILTIWLENGEVETFSAMKTKLDFDY